MLELCVHASRHLRRQPAFCLVVIATLALGIGANTAIFSLVYGLLLRPFPFHDPEQLVRLQTQSTRAGQAGVDISIPDLYDYRAANRAFTDIGIVAERSLDLIDGNAQSVNATLTTPGAFHALGVTPLLGRTFLEEEDRTGGDVYKAVLSYELWQARFEIWTGMLAQVAQDDERAIALGRAGLARARRSGDVRSMVPAAMLLDHADTSTRGPAGSPAKGSSSAARFRLAWVLSDLATLRIAFRTPNPAGERWNSLHILPRPATPAPPFPAPTMSPCKELHCQR